MPGRVPGIHVLLAWRGKDVDGRVKPGHDEFSRRWKTTHRNCYNGFGSFGVTKPPTTTVGVMRPVTPHSSQGCRYFLAST
jgi:hypothetical protein